jgi:hypothetical protein
MRFTDFPSALYQLTIVMLGEEVGKNSPPPKP